MRDLKFGLSQFIEKFAEVAADSDYSRHPKLRTATGDDIQAAGEALWWQAARTGRDREALGSSLGEADVVKAMLAQQKHYMDNDHLVSEEFRTLWDEIDKVNLTFDTREKIRTELTGKFLESERKQGRTVVDNGSGIWVFKFEGA